jgi:hypothetical protein
MLTKEGSQVRIRDKIATNGKAARHLMIKAEKALFFRESPDVGQTEQGLYIV